MNFETRFPASRRQRGSTLVGFIAGLILGLAMAVAVALAITKGATPFTDKAGKAGKTAEPTASQVADPNRPLYGNKNAARGAARDFAKEQRPPALDVLQQAIDELKPETGRPAPAPATAPAPAIAPAPAPPPAPARVIAPAHVPGADPAPPKTMAKAEPGEEKWIYYLQVGAFRETTDAENVRAKLALLGFEASITDRSTDNGVLHRVRMGPFPQVETMNRVRAKLAENGVDVAVVRNQK
jgi:cell division protein FtsN